jgi:hypothetical protein
VAMLQAPPQKSTKQSTTIEIQVRDMVISIKQHMETYYLMQKGILCLDFVGWRSPCCWKINIPRYVTPTLSTVWATQNPKTYFMVFLACKGSMGLVERVSTLFAYFHILVVVLLGNHLP